MGKMFVNFIVTDRMNLISLIIVITTVFFFILVIFKVEIELVYIGL